MTSLELIAQERTRQIEVEGFDAEHDDAHDEGEIANAATCYCAAAWYLSAGWNIRNSLRILPFPWNLKWWKPSEDPVRNLVKAGALIVAELERIQREKIRLDSATEKAREAL